jgi:hypothetical protein
MPVCSAIWDMVTDSSPCWVANAIVVSRIASRTSRRWASIVSVHNLGTIAVYDSNSDTDRIDRDNLYR